MADIELVIKIPEEVKNRLCFGVTYAKDIQTVCEALHNGTPIPDNPTKTGHCKDCKYFEYDSVVKVDGIPLIVAHELCKRWGDGCKTKEDGYCFLYEPQEKEQK